MNDSEDVYYGGVEGGGTKTLIVIMKQDGTVVSESEGPSSNHWLIGLDECAKRINDLATDAKVKAGLDPNMKLHAMGLSMSGGDSPEARKDIEASVRACNANLADRYFIGCDTEGAVATACSNGGIVLIAGTGSNCEVVNPGGGRHRVGGWGHLMGDEGSGYWISHYCMKTVFDTLDNLDPSPHDITFAKNVMCSHFKISDQMGMLSHLYTDFEKSNLAGMCKEIARGASELKDPLCLAVFHEAGRLLGRHVLAILPKVDKSLLEAEGGLNIVCVGSVFKSWSILKEGFLEGLQPRFEGEQTLKEFSLHELLKDARYGAAYLAGNAAGTPITSDYSKNSKIFFHHKLT